MSAALLWASRSAQSVLASRDLAEILKTYRRVNRISQRTLAAELGFDPSYVSLVERGLRKISDRGTLAHIARKLSIPFHVLGIAQADDVDFAAMLQFADSTIRLAHLARQNGNATTAVNELWPLVARLEARVADGCAEREVLILLTEARAALGTSLGHVLPQERLSAAARWTGRALAVANHLDDPALLGHALRMHGNETRKAGHPTAAIARLRQALTMTHNPTTRGETLVLLARAAGVSGNTDLFDETVSHCRRLLDHGEHSSLFNPFTVREVVLRGLLDTGRVQTAATMATTALDDTPPIIVPQWQIIERVTVGQVLLASGETAGGTEALHDAITAAETHRLPQQIQRAIHAARAVVTDTTRTVVERGTAIVNRFSWTARGADHRP